MQSSQPESFAWAVCRECDGLITDQAQKAVSRVSVATLDLAVGLRARHEEEGVGGIVFNVETRI
mgnify:CR=1 FL=1